MSHTHHPRGPANDIGDLIISDNKLGVGTSSDLSTLTVRAKASFNLTGTVAKTADSAIVTGTSTLFSSELATGDRITVAGATIETATVIAIGSDTSLTVDTPFLETATGLTGVALPSAARVDDASGTTQVVVNDQGNVGIGTSVPNGQLYVTGMGAGSAGQCPVVIGAHTPSASDAWALVLSTDAPGGEPAGVAFYVIADADGPALTFTMFDGNTVSNVDFMRIDANGLHLEQAGFTSSPTAIAADYTIASIDHYVQADAGTNGITITLPPIGFSSGRELFIYKWAGAGDVTIAPAPTENINGANANKAISTQYSGIRLIGMNGTWIATLLTAA